MELSLRGQLEEAVQLAALELYGDNGSKGFRLDLPHARGTLLFVCGTDEEMRDLLQRAAATPALPEAMPQD